jgi:hypothetical protein
VSVIAGERFEGRDAGIEGAVDERAARCTREALARGLDVVADLDPDVAVIVRHRLAEVGAQVLAANPAADAV